MRTLSVLEKVEILTNNITIQPGFKFEVTDLILPYSYPLKEKNYIRFKTMEKIRCDSKIWSLNNGHCKSCS